MVNSARYTTGFTRDGLLAFFTDESGWLISDQTISGSVWFLTFRSFERQWLSFEARGQVSDGSVFLFDSLVEITNRDADAEILNKINVAAAMVEALTRQESISRPAVDAYRSTQNGGIQYQIFDSRGWKIGCFWLTKNRLAIRSVLAEKTLQRGAVAEDLPVIPAKRLAPSEAEYISTNPKTWIPGEEQHKTKPSTVTVAGVRQAEAAIFAARTNDLNIPIGLTHEQIKSDYIQNGGWSVVTETLETYRPNILLQSTGNDDLTLNAFLRPGGGADVVALEYSLKFASIDDVMDYSAKLAELVKPITGVSGIERWIQQAYEKTDQQRFGTLSSKGWRHTVCFTADTVIVSVTKTTDPAFGPYKIWP